MVWAYLAGIILGYPFCAHCADGLEESCPVGHHCSSSTSSVDYYWPQFNGRPEHPRTSPYVGPLNFSTSLAWTWQHPKGRYCAWLSGMPAIDDKLNIYLSSGTEIYKLSPNGQALWVHNHGPTRMSDTPAIMGGSLFGACDGEAFALDMETGEVQWQRRLATSMGDDGASIFAIDGRVLYGMGRTEHSGTRKAMAVNATDGSFLWEFEPEQSIWNFAPVFTKHGSLVFQNENGGVYHLRLSDGSLLWKTGYSNSVHGYSWTDGGTMLGPNDVVYSVHSEGHIVAGKLGPYQPGSLSAYKLSDGRLLWRQDLPHPPNSWPVVASLGKGKPLTVIMPIGAQGTCLGINNLPTWIPDYLKIQMHRLSLWMGDWGQLIYGPYGCIDRYPQVIKAFDAETGSPKWEWKYVWKRSMAAGDEKIPERAMAFFGGCLPIWQLQGLPNPWGAPIVDAAGTIYIGGQDGKIYAFQEVDGIGKMVDSFDTGCSFYSPGPSLAAGMLAVMNMETLYVFKV